MFSAYSDYSARLKRLDEFVQIDKSCSTSIGTTRPEKLDLVTVVRESLSILPVSYYEDFLKSLIRQFIECLNSAKPQSPWHTLPENIRKTHLYESDLSFSKKTPPGTPFETHEINTFRDLKRISDAVLSPFKDPVGYEIYVEPFLATNSNPDSDSSNQLFNRIGLTDVFSNPIFVDRMTQFEGKFSSREVIRRELNSIVEHRHVIAHGGSILSKTISELEYSISFMDAIGNAFETLCISHLATISPNSRNNHQRSNSGKLKNFILRTPLKSAIKSLHEWLED